MGWGDWQFVRHGPLDRGRPTRSTWLARGAPSRFERPNSTDKGTFSSISVDFGIDFRRFSRRHRASNSTCRAKRQTFVFAGRRSTLEGSLAVRRAQTSTQFDAKSFRRWCANEPRGKELDSIAPGRDFASILVTSACIRALLGARSGVPGRSWGPSEVFRRAPGTPPDALETLLERCWATQCVPRGWRDRFCVEFGCPGATSDIDFGSISYRSSDRFRERAGQRGCPGRSTCHRSGLLDLAWLSSMQLND